MGLIILPVLALITWLQSGSSGIGGISLPEKRASSSASVGVLTDCRLILTTLFLEGALFVMLSSLMACSIRCSPSHLLFCVLSDMLLRKVIIPSIGTVVIAFITICLLELYLLVGCKDTKKNPNRLAIRIENLLFLLDDFRHTAMDIDSGTGGLAAQLIALEGVPLGVGIIDGDGADAFRDFV